MTNPTTSPNQQCGPHGSLVLSARRCPRRGSGSGSARSGHRHRRLLVGVVGRVTMKLTAPVEGFAGRDTATRRHLRPRVTAGRAAAAAPADHIRLTSPMREPQFPRTAPRTRIMRLAMFQEEDRGRALRGRPAAGFWLLDPHGASCHWAPTLSRPHIGGVSEIIRELTSMPLGIRKISSRSRRVGIALAELAHEGRTPPPAAVRA